MSARKQASPEAWDREVEELVSLINADLEADREWREGDDGCSEAEYVASLGYGDGELELDNLDDDLAEKVRDLKGKLSKAAFRRLIQRCSDLEFEDSFRCRANSVFSLPLGEVELQLDDAIYKRLKRLPKAAMEKLEREVGTVSHGCAYWGSDGYWHLILNEDRLERAWKAIRRSSPSWKRLRRQGTKAPAFRPANTPMHRRAQMQALLGGGQGRRRGRARLTLIQGGVA